MALYRLQTGNPSATFTQQDVIKPNRDYYQQISGTAFDGSAGVGQGTLAERPAACTPSVAYWATDQGEWNGQHPGPDGQLYKCKAKDTWVLEYIPYIYPHPITVAPSAPAVLVVK